MTTFLSKELHADLTRAQKDKKLKKVGLGLSLMEPMFQY